MAEGTSLRLVNGYGATVKPAWIVRLFDVNTWIYPEEENPFYLELAYPDAHFQKERGLWLNPAIAEQLGITMCVDYLPEGIIGMNEQEETVLRMMTWRCAYYGNDDYHGQEFPMSRGSQLYMREDYVRKMESMFGKMEWREDN